MNNLPPLPEPNWHDCKPLDASHRPFYTADQMQAYAHAAIEANRVPTAQPAEPVVSDVLPPTLPQSLLYTIGEYGMARTDKASPLEVTHRWCLVIDGIKAYAADFVKKATQSQQSTQVQQSAVMPEFEQYDPDCWEMGQMTRCTHGDWVKLSDVAAAWPKGTP